MTSILCLILLFALANSNFLAKVQERDYTQGLNSVATIIEMAPKTEKFYGHYPIDFAIGTHLGWIYFGNFNEETLEHSFKITKNSIKKMVWNTNGLFIFSDDEVKVIKDFYSMVVNLDIKLSNQTQKAFFGYSAIENVFLTAVTAYDLIEQQWAWRIEIFKNATSFYNISTTSEIKAIAFSFEGDQLSFIQEMFSNSTFRIKSFLKKFHIPTLNLATFSESNTNSSGSLRYIPVEEGTQYSLVSISVFSPSKLTIWSENGTQTVSLNQLKLPSQMSQDGKSLIGKNIIYDKGFISLTQLDFKSRNSFSLGDSKYYSLPSHIVSFDAKRGYLLALTAYNKVTLLCTSGFLYYFWTKLLQYAVIIIFLALIVLSCIGCYKVIQICRERQYGGYFEQVDVVKQLGSQNFKNRSIELTELRVRHSTPNS